jgi:iron complex transport system substrate-binding protein
MRRSLFAVLALSLAISAAGGEAARAAVHRSKGFSIEYREGYKLVSVKAPWPGASRGYAYALYPRGAPRPAGISADGFFEVPLRRVVTFSTTYLPQISAIGEAASVVGVDDAANVSDPTIRSRIASGAVAEAARNWAPNVELLIALAPDAVFAYGMGNEWDQYPKLAEAGLPVVLSGEWNETDPLARAEWIEFIAAFYDREGRAQELYAETAAEYERIRAIAAKEADRPRVLVNGPFQGAWPVSGGASYMAKLIADAGAAYLWSDDSSTGGLTLSVEAVFERALRADYWLNPSQAVTDRAGIAALDPRLAALPAVRAGRVWNATLRMGPGGGNDYYESAVLHPDLVLSDLVKIFHPSLLADRPFVYYRNIGK